MCKHAGVTRQDNDKRSNELVKVKSLKAKLASLPISDSQLQHLNEKLGVLIECP